MSQNVSGATGYQGTGANSAINKKAKITHLFTLLAVGVAVLYAIIASLLHFYVLSLFCVGIVVAFGSCNLLNRYGYLDMARICLILSADAFVFYISGSLGEASSLRPLYFPLVCSIFMLFDLKDVNKIVALGAVSLGCLAIGEYTHYALFLIPFISQNTSQIISSSTFFASIATSIACIFYLVSVNTQSEKYLDRERLNNKSIIDNTDDIILLVNRKYEVEVMNIALERSFKRMFGDKFGIGSNVVDMINAIDGIPPQFKQWKSHYDRAFTGEKFSFEEKGQAPTGDFRYLETVFNPVLRGGEVTGVAIFIHDITARKNLEESIKRLNAGQKAIIDGGNYSIISVGLDGLVTSFNKGSEVIDKHDTMTFSMDDIKKLPKTEIVYNFKCIEGWCQITHWGGARVIDFINQYKLATHSGKPLDPNNPKDMAGYMGLQTPDGEYYVGLDMKSAIHPQTLLCYELNGKPLPYDQGAPLRLIIPIKYGIKSLKRIGIIFFSDKRPADYWYERGYDYDAAL